MSATPRYPEITVRPRDGNAYSVMGAAAQAMRRAGVPPAEVDEYLAEATSDDYNHLLAVTMAWVELEPSS